MEEVGRQGWEQERRCLISEEIASRDPIATLLLPQLGLESLWALLESARKCCPTFTSARPMPNAALSVVIILGLKEEEEEQGEEGLEIQLQAIQGLLSVYRPYSTEATPTMVVVDQEEVGREMINRTSFQHGLEELSRLWSCLERRSSLAWSGGRRKWRRTRRKRV